MRGKITPGACRRAICGPCPCQNIASRWDRQFGISGPHVPRLARVRPFMDGSGNGCPSGRLVTGKDAVTFSSLTMPVSTRVEVLLWKDRVSGGRVLFCEPLHLRCPLVASAVLPASTQPAKQSDSAIDRAMFYRVVHRPRVPNLQLFVHADWFGQEQLIGQRDVLCEI